MLGFVYPKHADFLYYIQTKAYSDIYEEGLAKNIA